MVKPASISRTSRGVELFVPAVGGWDGFDRLLAFLIKHYGAIVVDAIDGPDARVCHLRVQGAELTLDFEDPYGNAIACAERDRAILDEIARDLQRRLRLLDPAGGEDAEFAESRDDE